MFVVPSFTNSLFIPIPCSESLRWETLTTVLSLFLQYSHTTINLTLFMKYLIAYCSQKKKKKRQEKEHGALRENCLNTEFLSVFSPNTEKYGP